MEKNSLLYKIFLNFLFLIMFFLLFKESAKFDIIITLILVIIFLINLKTIKKNNLKTNFFMLILNTIIFFFFSYYLPISFLFCGLLTIMYFPIDIYLVNLNIRDKKVSNIKSSMFLWFTSILNCLITLFMLWFIFKEELETFKPFSYFLIAIVFILIVVFYDIKVILTIKKNKTEIRLKDSLLFLTFNHLIILMYITFNLLFYEDVFHSIKWSFDFYPKYYVLFLYLFIILFYLIKCFLEKLWKNLKEIIKLENLLY